MEPIPSAAVLFTISLFSSYERVQELRTPAHALCFFKCGLVVHDINIHGHRVQCICAHGAHVHVRFGWCTQDFIARLACL